MNITCDITCTTGAKRNILNFVFEFCDLILNVEFNGLPISVFKCYFLQFKALITVTFSWNMARSDHVLLDSKDLLFLPHPSLQRLTTCTAIITNKGFGT